MNTVSMGWSDYDITMLCFECAERIMDLSYEEWEEAYMRMMVSEPLTHGSYAYCDECSYSYSCPDKKA